MKRSATLTAETPVKAIAGWAAASYLAWYVISEPTNAAHLAHNTAVFFSTAGAGLSAFFAAMPPWMVVVPIFAVVLVAMLIAIRRIAQSARRHWDASTALSLLEGLTKFSALIAGRRRPHTSEEWRGNIAYSIAEADGTQRSQQLLRYAVELIIAAARYRLRDTADLIWRPIDALLESRKLSNLTISAPVLFAAVAIVHRDGIYGIVSNAENLFAIGGFFYAAIRGGRRWRGVKPAKHKPSNARN